MPFETLVAAKPPKTQYHEHGATFVHITGKCYAINLLTSLIRQLDLPNAKGMTIDMLFDRDANKIAVLANTCGHRYLSISENSNGTPQARIVCSELAEFFPVGERFKVESVGKDGFMFVIQAVGPKEKRRERKSKRKIK